MNKDFRDSEKIYQNLSQKISQTLRPDAKSVFLRLSLIHLLSSLLTLSVCPQFGFRFFGEGHGLMSYFMKAGDLGCFALCGAFYLGTTVLISGLSFNKYQWRVFTQHSGLMLTALTALSLGAFMMLDTTFVLDLTIMWVLGALLVSFVPVKMVQLYRQKFV